MDLPRQTSESGPKIPGNKFSVDEHGRSLFNAVLATSVPPTAPVTQTDPTPPKTEEELDQDAQDHSKQRERTFFSRLNWILAFLLLTGMVGAAVGVLIHTQRGPDSDRSDALISAKRWSGDSLNTGILHNPATEVVTRNDDTQPIQLHLSSIALVNHPALSLHQTCCIDRLTNDCSGGTATASRSAIERLVEVLLANDQIRRIVQQKLAAQDYSDHANSTSTQPAD